MRVVRVRPAYLSIHGIFLGLGILIALVLSTPVPLLALPVVAWMLWRHR